MTDTTIRRIVREVFNGAILAVGALLLAALLGLLFSSMAHSQTAPCAGKTAKQQCECLGMEYDPHLKPVPGCVVGTNHFEVPTQVVIQPPAAPEPQAKPSFELNIPYPSPSPTNVHDYALSRLKVGLEWKEIPANKDIYTIGLFTYNWRFRDKKVQKFSIDPTGKVELDNMSADDAILLLASDLVMEQRKAKPTENIAPPAMFQEQHTTTILPPAPPPSYKNYMLLEVPPNDWLQEYGHWHKLRWRDWSCYKVSFAIDGKGRQMFSCKLNRKITGKEK